MTRRPMVSQLTTISAPKRAEAGSRKRLSDPISIRMMCGAISPTNPSRPATLTADAASKAAVAISRKRTRSVFSPSPIATSSPSARMLSFPPSENAARNADSM